MKFNFPDVLGTVAVVALFFTIIYLAVQAV